MLGRVHPCNTVRHRRINRWAQALVHIRAPLYCTARDRHMSCKAHFIAPSRVAWYSALKVHHGFAQRLHSLPRSISRPTPRWVPRRCISPLVVGLYPARTTRISRVAPSIHIVMPPPLTVRTSLVTEDTLSTEFDFQAVPCPPPPSQTWIMLLCDTNVQLLMMTLSCTKPLGGRHSSHYLTFPTVQGLIVPHRRKIPDYRCVIPKRPPTAMRPY